MQIFEPAMCCSTGLCGVGVDPELLRISTVLSTLKTNGIEIDRFNLASNPQEFISNTVVNEFLDSKGINDLPVTLLDNVIVLSGKYPSNEELVTLLDIPMSFLGDQPKKTLKATVKKSSGCGCSDGNCC